MPTKPVTLELVRRLLRGLTVLNLVYGAGIAVLLIASLAAEERVFGALGMDFGATRGGASLWGMRLIMVLGVASAGVTHLVLTRLVDMVATVRGGDPFIAENAFRLALIARAVLGLELLRMAILLASRITPLRIELDVSGAITRWLAVLLLFVLAWVFEQGARMREELAGTV